MNAGFMPYRQKRLLLDEIVRQCDFALIGYRDASTAVQKNENQRMWYSLHALVGAAVHLQQLLGCAQELEGILGDLPSPLTQPDLANTADWAELVRNCQGARCSFDPHTAILMLFGRVFELQPMLAAIAELRKQAEDEVQLLKAIV
jgi:hypothetical protein